MSTCYYGEDKLMFRRGRKNHLKDITAQFAEKKRLLDEGLQGVTANRERRAQEGRSRAPEKKGKVSLPGDI